MRAFKSAYDVWSASRKPFLAATPAPVEDAQMLRAFSVTLRNVSDAEARLDFDLYLDSESSRHLNSTRTLKQLQPVIRIHLHRRLHALLRRHTECPQEIPVHVAFALHGVAGEQAVERSFISGGERCA
jgi:hypothetical protein